MTNIDILLLLKKERSPRDWKSGDGWRFCGSTYYR